MTLPSLLRFRPGLGSAHRTTVSDCQSRGLLAEQSVGGVELADTVVLCVSADLPFAQSRFCGAEGLSNVVTLSTLRAPEFLQTYGVGIADGALKGLAARAVVVIDENDSVVYSELVNEITNEPDYDAALAALKA